MSVVYSIIRHRTVGQGWGILPRKATNLVCRLQYLLYLLDWFKKRGTRVFTANAYDDNTRWNYKDLGRQNSNREFLLKTRIVLIRSMLLTISLKDLLLL